nr:alpha/beta hydrolase fold-1 [Tanacetum cinerariifolium]
MDNLFSYKQLISLQPLYNIITRFPVVFADALLSVYFRYCGLARSSVHIDDNQTTMYFWGSKHREYKKPNLVLIHGFGGNSKWQFLLQIRQLARDFNVYVPDLVFFGESYSSKSDRRNVVDLLVAKTPEDLRMLCRISIHKYDIGKWIPDFFLWGFIGLEFCGKEKEELVHELLNDKPDIDLQILTQETLLIWGENDGVFPLEWAYQLHRHLGGKSKLEIIRDVGHALNFEAPYSLNRLITSFVLD